tara:strand:- start:213 stop:338 length:126 start_codon:yes stop_codon:yes gene_type:complete
MINGEIETMYNANLIDQQLIFDLSIIALIALVYLFTRKKDL